jgi:transposase
MKHQRQLFVGIDIDDTSYHIAGFDKQTGEIFEYKCRASINALKDKLKQIAEKGYDLKICYESSYVGYSICRALISSGYNCSVIASSLIPKQSSARVKTDRIDSRKLAVLYAKDLLTEVSLPDEQDEELRRLIRTRAFLVVSRKKLKQHILSNCRAMGIDYQQSSASKASYWTHQHLKWLNCQIMERSDFDKWNMSRLLEELIRADSDIEIYDKKIIEIAETERYRERCRTLSAFKGFKTLSSMTLIAEFGDIRRFSHPSKLVSYAGMGISEYSSGGKERKFGMTKMGNRHIRTVLIEACQNTKSDSTVSKRLQSRRNEVPPNILSIVERCQQRLHKKRMKLIFGGKHINKVKAACAREMLGFIWEALYAVAA